MSPPTCPGRARRRGARGARPAPTPRSARDLRALGVDGRRAAPRARADHARDWWPVSIAGRRTPGASRAGRRSSRARPRTEQVRRGRARRARPGPRGHGPGRALGRRGRRGRAGRGARPRPDRPGRACSTSTTSHARYASRPAASGPSSRRRRDATGLTVGHFPQSFDLSTVGGLARLPRARASTRTATARSADIVRGLTVVLASGDVVAPRGPARRARRPVRTSSRLFVGSRGRARRHHRGDARGPARAAAPRRARAYRFAAFADGLGRLPPSPPARRVPRGPAPLRRGRVGAPLRGRRLRRWSSSTRATRRSSRRDDVGRSTTPAPRRRGARRVARRALARAAQRRRALGAALGGGVCVDTIEIAGAWRRSSRRCTATSIAALRALDGTARRLGPPVPRLPRRRVPLLHLRRAARGRPRRLLPRARGTRRSRGAVLGRGAALSHHHGVGRNRARYVAARPGRRATGVLVAIKAALDPTACSTRASSGWAGRRGEGARHRRGHDLGAHRGRRRVTDAVSATRTAGACARHAPAPGIVELDPAEDRRRRARARPRTLADAGGADVVGVTNQRATTIVFDPATGEPVGPALGWQDLRTVIDCLVAAGRGPAPRAEPVGDQGARGSCASAGRAASGLALRHRRDLGRTGASSGRARHRPLQRRRHRPRRPGDRSTWDRAGPRGPRDRGPRHAPRSSTPPGPARARARCPGPRPSPPWSATSRRRSSASHASRAGPS